MIRVAPLLLSLALGACLPSCAVNSLARYRNAGEDIPLIQYNIKRGKSTQKQVVGWLGQPMMKTTQGGRETWIYSGHTMERKGWAGFVEGMGMGAQGASAVMRAGATAGSAAATGGMMLVAAGVSGMMMPKNMSSMTATIQFDASGVVADYWINQTDVDFSSRGMPGQMKPSLFAPSVVSPNMRTSTRMSTSTTRSAPTAGKVRTDDQGTQYLVP